MSSEMIIEEQINKLNNRINIEKKEIEEIENIIKEIPQEMIQEYSSNKENEDESLETLEETLLIMKQIDKIKNINDIDEILDSLNIIMNSEIIDYSFKKDILKDTIKNDFYTKIESGLISIKFPIFDGQLLIGIFENIKQNNYYNLIKKYISVISSISQNYKEEANYGNIKKIEKKEGDIISELIFKRMITSILNKENLKDNKKNKESIIDLLETIISYLSKCLSNSSELFNLISTNDSENFDILSIIKYISNNLFSKIVLLFISNENFQLSNLNYIEKIKVIQKITEFNEELLTSYHYDSLKNISLYDWIKDNIENEINEINENQKRFSNYMVDKIKEKINNEIEKKTYEIEEVMDLIKMIIKDNQNLYICIRNYKVMENIIIPSIGDIIKVFRIFYNNDVNIFNFRKNEMSKENILFIANILSHFMNFINGFFSNFYERTSLFDISFNEKTSELSIISLKEITELQELYSKLMSKLDITME